MKYYSSVPDNEDAFFAFINLVINNKENANVPENPIAKPLRFGPVGQFDYYRNYEDGGELYIETYSKRDNRMIEMFMDQFQLLRTYWNYIESEVKYKNASKYDNKLDFGD